MIASGQLLGIANKVLEESVKQAIETYLKSDEGRSCSERSSTFSLLNK